MKIEIRVMDDGFLVMLRRDDGYRGDMFVDSWEEVLLSVYSGDIVKIRVYKKATCDVFLEHEVELDNRDSGETEFTSSRYPGVKFSISVELARLIVKNAEENADDAA